MDHSVSKVYLKLFISVYGPCLALSNWQPLERIFCFCHSLNIFILEIKNKIKEVLCVYNVDFSIEEPRLKQNTKWDQVPVSNSLSLAFPLFLLRHSQYGYISWTISCDTEHNQFKLKIRLSSCYKHFNCCEIWAAMLHVALWEHSSDW